MIVKVSAKYEVTIPKGVRDELGLKPGDPVEFFDVRPGTLKFRKANKHSSTDVKAKSND